MADIDISGIGKAAVLAALYNGSRPQGLGFMSYDANAMTVDEAQQIINEYRERMAEFGDTRLYFDYLQGRVMKVELSEDTLNPGLYDRDNGEGAAARIIAELRRDGSINGEAAKQTHVQGRTAAAEELHENVDTPTETTVHGGALTITLGYDDLANTARYAGGHHSVRGRSHLGAIWLDLFLDR